MTNQRVTSITLDGFRFLFLSIKPARKQAKTALKMRLVFNGKELDAETGYGYFGARYYDATLLTGWTAVDPMSDKYPNISPYAYCAWNPVKLVDPDGRDVEIIKNDGDKTITIRSNFYYNKAQLGAEADVFLAGFKVALGSWENDIRTALGDESLGVSDYSINFEAEASFSNKLFSILWEIYFSFRPSEELSVLIPI